MFKTTITAVLSILFSLNALGVVLRGESRIQIHNPKDYRASKVGFLEVWNNDSPKKKAYCSAANLSHGYVITAAHCVIDITRAKKYDNIVYYPRHVDFMTRSPSRVFIQTAYVPKDYIKGNMRQSFDGNASLSSITNDMIKNDIAILYAYSDRMQEKIGSLYGYYGYSPVPNSYYSGHEFFNISLSSYPGDKDTGTLWYEECLLTLDSRYAGKISCDTFPGSSGAAVVSSKTSKIIAIMSAEDQIKRVNKVAVITDEIANAIGQVINGNYQNSLFKRLNINTEKFYYFHVQNKCKKPIRVALRMQKTDNNWITLEMTNIGQNQKNISSFSSNNAIYYYYAETHERKRGSSEPLKSWYDAIDGVVKTAFGRDRHFYRKETSPGKNNAIRWGDWYRVVDCPDL